MEKQRLPARELDRDTRFRLAIQRNRAVVLPTAAGIGFLLKATVGVEATYLQILVVISIALLSALLVHRYYLHGWHHRLGFGIDYLWLFVDLGIITYGIHLSGGIDSVWAVWYLANIAGAAFARGPGAAAFIALADTLAYLGILVAFHGLSWNDPALLRPILFMAMLYAASFFFLIGVAELQRKRLQVQSLGENERRKVEELTRVTAALEQRSGELADANLRIREADRLKTQFLANMSHELRTPLNSIIGFSEILSTRLGERLRPEESRFLDHIHGSGQHLLEIINDILDLSKIEAGKMPLVVEEVSIPDVIEGICSVMRPIAGERRIAVEVHLEDELPVIEADPVKVKQILYNLLSNAVKFSYDDSVVTVTAHSIPASSSPLGVATIDIAVIDHGIGIQPEDRQLIFEAFRQADGTAGRKHQGTGLGLALVRRLVQLHGGQVEVETSVGVGSTFRVSLPIASPIGPTPGRAQPPEPEGLLPEGPKILVIEDDPTAYETIRDALQGTPYFPLRATHAKEALEQARRYRPTAITLDLILPGEDGWEILRQLRDDAETCDIPVIIVSMIDDHELGVALGADAYLPKPVQREPLLQLLESCQQRRKISSPRLLVIDDDPRLHDLLDGYLAPLGYELRHAHSGPEGLAMMTEANPDLVILDLMMDGMDGFEVAARLHAEPATRSHPIVVLTAKELEPSERESLRGRISALVRKQGSQHQLVSVIEDLVARRRGETQGA